MKKIVILTLIVSVCVTAFAQKAAPRKFPHGCRELGFSFENNRLLLSELPDGQEQTLYLIHNRAPFEISVKAAAASKFIPTYDKIIRADSWLTFARDVKHVDFGCFSTEGTALDCGETLEVCNYNNVKFPESNFGTYWITNSGSQSEAVYGSIRKGILLRW